MSSWGRVTHSWTQAKAGSLGALGTMEGLILTSRGLSLSTPTVFALVHSGSARLILAALWFTLDPSLQSCCTDAGSPSRICAAGYSHLSEGNCVCTTTYSGATGANLPELWTAGCSLGGLCCTGRVGGERTHEDKVSVFPKFKTCKWLSQHAIQALFIVLQYVPFFVFTIYYFAFLIWSHLANPVFLTLFVDTANPLIFEVWTGRSPGFKSWSRYTDSCRGLSPPSWGKKHHVPLTHS